MISSKNRLTRRSVPRGAAGISVALPFLDAMLLPGQSHAASAIPLRFVVFYSPGGTLLDKWRPTGTETNYALGDMMASLNPYKDRMMFLDGLDLSITAKGVGHPHSRGMAGVLTGTQLLPGDFETGGGGASFADGPSIDQVIAGRIGQGLKFQSLEFSSGWSISGRSAGELSFAADQLTMAGSKKPIPPMTSATAAFANAKTKSILDVVSAQFTKLSAQLGPSDRAKLGEHLDMIRQMETSLTASVSTDPSCVVPPMPTSAGGTPTNPMQSGTGVVVTATDIPATGKVMTDLLVASLACDLTRVGTMQWADSEAKFILNFDPLNMPDHHHAYQHEKGFQPDGLLDLRDSDAQRSWADQHAVRLGGQGAGQGPNGSLDQDQAPAAQQPVGFAEQHLRWHRHQVRRSRLQQRRSGRFDLKRARSVAPFAKHESVMKERTCATALL